MSQKTTGTWVSKLAANAAAVLSIFAVSSVASADVIEQIEAGKSLRAAVSSEARYSDGLTSGEMAQALSSPSLFDASLMLLYASEEHPTRACEYIDVYKRLGRQLEIGKTVLIALENNSGGAHPILRCLAKFSPEQAGRVYVDVLIESEDAAHKVLAVYQSVDPEASLLAYRLGLRVRSDSSHCAALAQLCGPEREINYDLSGTSSHGLVGGEAYAHYAISTQYTDNVNRASASTEANSALVFEPAFAAKRAIGKLSVVAAGDAALSASRQSDEQAYADFAGLFGTEYKGLFGIQMNFGGTYLRSHDATGTGRDEGGANTDGLDRWEKTTARLALKSQSPYSPISIELTLQGDEYHYLNNEADTNFMDRLSRTGSLHVAYQISEGAQLGIGTKRQSVSYEEEPTAARDFDENTYWLTVNASVTQALGIRLEGGITDRQLRSDVGEIVQRGYWDAKVDWVPVSQTRFSVASAGSNSQSYDIGTDYLKHYSASVAWYNDWLSAGKWSTEFSLHGLRTQHIGRATPRQDETISYAIQFNRKVGSNALISANFTRDDRESDVAVNEYLRDTATITMSTSF